MRLAAWLSVLVGGAALVLAVRLAQAVPGPWQSWIGAWAPALLLMGVVAIITGIGGLIYDARPLIREGLDALPVAFRSPVIRKRNRPPKPEPVLAARGMWDFRRDGERAMNSMTRIQKQIATEMERSSTLVVRHAARMSAAAAKPNPSVEKGYKLGARAAAEVARHAKAMEGLEARYRQARIAMTQNFSDWFKGLPAGTDLRTWATGLREMAQVGGALRTSTDGYLESVRDLRNQNFHQPFNQATERLISVLTALIEDIESTEKFAQGSLEMLDEKGVKKP